MNRPLKKQFVIRDYRIADRDVVVTWGDEKESRFDQRWLKTSVRNDGRFAMDSLEYTENPLICESTDHKIERAELKNGSLLIQWRDEAEEFDTSWLRVQDNTLQEVEDLENKPLWDSSFEIPSKTYADALADSDWILDLDRTGILKVTGIKPGDAKAAEKALRSIAAKIGVLHRRIHPTDINVLMPAAKNVGLDKAYTGKKLEYHTDAPYYDPPPKIAFLYCQSIEGGAPPTNYFSDGYKVARELEKTQPEYYKLLTSVCVNFARRRPRSHHEDAGSGQTDYALDTQVFAPMIKLDVQRNPSIMRAHTRSVTGLPPQYSAEEIAAYANAFRLYYHRMLGQDRFVRQTVIDPGTLIIFDNHRLVHARSEIGKTRRVANLCYIDPYIWDSRIRLLLGEKSHLPGRWLKGCPTRALAQLANRWA